MPGQRQGGTLGSSREFLARLLGGGDVEGPQPGAQQSPERISPQEFQQQIILRLLNMMNETRGGSQPFAVQSLPPELLMPGLNFGAMGPQGPMVR